MSPDVLLPLSHSGSLSCFLYNFIFSITSTPRTQALTLRALLVTSSLLQAERFPHLFLNWRHEPTLLSLLSAPSLDYLSRIKYVLECDSINLDEPGLNLSCSRSSLR